MSETPPVVDAQVRHLLAVVHRHRDEACARLLAQAVEQAQQVVREARRDARLRMRQAVSEAREHFEQERVAAEARLHTQRRQRRQRADQALLVEAWPRLRGALQRRWRDSSGRRAWVEALLTQASTALVSSDWLIEHAPDWPSEERDTVGQRLATQLGQAPAFAERSDMVAGLRVRGGAACVDGSLDGLLGERAAIEALLLAAVHRRRGADQEPGPAAGGQPPAGI
jgi:hypothetical protein